MPPTSSQDSINAADAISASAFRSWIDQPRTTSIASTHVVIRGWCYHRAGSRVRGIRARVAARSFTGYYGAPRPDVHAAFGGESGSDASGFEIAVVFPAQPVECVIEARIADGPWQSVQSFRPIPAASSRQGGSLKWLRFWMGAWLGRPAVYEMLSADERDYVVAWARQRHWLNLQLAPQHPPRTVAPERLPGKGSAARVPRAAIVTPSFQQGAFLEATIRSVLDQEGLPFDYVVQDGGSNDGSLEIIRRYAPRLKHWESAPDRGQADAIVRGFAHTEGRPDDIMMYLNSDDLLAPGALRHVARVFAAHPEVDVVYGHRVLIDEAGLEVGRWFTPRRACDDLRLHDLIPQETLFWRRRVWDRVGGIDPGFHFALDWDLLLRFAEAGARFARIPRFLGMFRLHGSQKSQRELELKGISEMEKLRLRTLGRPPTSEEMHRSMRRAQLDSALLCALARRGIRV